MALYDVGERVVIPLTLRDDDGVLVNADVVLTVTLPDGSTLSPVLSNPSTGIYEGSIIASLAGDYSYVASSTGFADVVDEGGFSAVPAGSGRKSYCTTDELRAHLGDGTRRNLDETELRRAIIASSRAIDRHTGSFFWRDFELTTKFYDVSSRGSIRILPLATLAGAVVSYDPSGLRNYSQTFAIDTDIEFGPDNQDLEAPHAYTEIYSLRRFLPWGRKALSVTGYHGWSAIPDAVREATVIKATSLFKRGDSPFGIAGTGDFGAIRISRFEDPDVVKLLEPFTPVLMGVI